MKAFLLSLFIALAVAAPTASNSNGDPVELIVNGVPEGTPLALSDIVDVKVQHVSDGEVVAAADLLYPLTAQGLAEAAVAAESANDEIHNNMPEADFNLPESASLPSPAQPEIIPESVVLPAPVMPEVVPEPIVLPAPVMPEVVPEAVALPAPAIPEVIPEPVALPAPAVPEVIPEPVALPAPAVPEIVPEPVALPAPAVPEVIPEPVVLPAPAVPEIVPEPVALPAPPAPVVEVPAPAPVATAPQGEIYNDGIVSVTVNTAHAAVSSTLQYLQSWYSIVINYFNNGQEVQHVL